MAATLEPERPVDAKPFGELSLHTPEPSLPTFAGELDLTKFLGIGTLDGSSGGFSEDCAFTTRRTASDGWLEFAIPPFDLTRDLGRKLQLLHLKDLIKLTFSVDNGKLSARLYVLPSDNGFPARQLSVLNAVLAQVDTSKEAWDAKPTNIRTNFDAKVSNICRSSLFAMFNSLPSPNPKWVTGTIHDDVLQNIRTGYIAGLKTKPFNYQRRSAALMLEREIDPERFLDPYLEQKVSPGGRNYYVLSAFSKSPSKIILQDPLYVEDVRGGILAEEMGTGKTLTCLMLILATKHYAAEMPPEKAERDTSGVVLSLMDICAKVILTKSVPWTNEALEVPAPLQNHILSARERLRADIYSAKVSKVSKRANIEGGKSVRIRLAKGSIVVVPPNLINQWEGEIEKHCEAGALRYVKLMDNIPIPSVNELLDLELVLITRARFDKEVQEDTDQRGRKKPTGVQVVCNCPYLRATRIPDCTCPKESDYYESPLLKVHWKRIIVDEGHSMTSTKTNSMEVAQKLHVQSRWAVSGTPTSGFFTAPKGVDLDKEENSILKDFATAEESDLKKIGTILRHFLKSSIFVRHEAELLNRDWPTSLTNLNRHVIWNFLQRTIVRHQISDVEEEVKLPPMNHKVVSLAPGYLERITLNLFLALFTTNAVTSEREDQDYMFHPSQRSQLNTFVSNLKTATIYWTAFDDIGKTLEIARKYLDGALAGIKKCHASDISLLQRAISAGEEALASSFWNAISTSHDMGYFISDLPDAVADAWSIGGPILQKSTAPYAVLGSAQTIQMQKFLSSYAFALDPESCTRALKSEGERVLEISRKREDRKSSTNPSGMSTKESNATSPQKKIKGPSQKKAHAQRKNSASFPAKGTQKGILKETKTSFTIDLLHRDSPLRHTAIMGTASVKLSYLLDRIITLSPEEKIIVFFESEEIAYYLAESLDILAIPYLLYAKSLDLHRKSEYLVTFNTNPHFRVFLMSVRQATYGINLYSASRMFFISPLWGPPSVEAQALKRAHRIGQTRPVFVETLVLQGTIEEEMLRRRQNMSEADFRSHRLMMDDSGLRDILSNAKFLDSSDSPTPARLAHPQLLFGEGKTGEMPENPDVGIVKIATARNQAPSPAPSLGEDSGGPSTNTKKRRRVLFVVDDDSESDGAVTLRAPAPVPDHMDWMPHRHDVESEPKRSVTFTVPNEATTSTGDAAYRPPPPPEKQKSVIFTLPVEGRSPQSESVTDTTVELSNQMATSIPVGSERGPGDDAMPTFEQPPSHEGSELPPVKKPRVTFADI